MGLDIVELIMRVEEEFEIEIGDEEASQISTAGQLSQLVGWKLKVEPSTGCASSAAFYQTRRDLMAVTGVPRGQIRPRTPLDQIFTPPLRRAQWQQTGARTGSYLPDLSLSRWLSGLIWVPFFAVLTLAFVCFAAGEWPFSFAVSVGAVASLGVALTLAKPWARHFPASCQSAGDLTRLVLISRFKSLPESPKSAEIWELTRALIADELSIPLEKVTPNADLIRDLGAD